MSEMSEKLKDAVLSKCERLVESAPNGIWQNEKATMHKNYSYRVETHDDTIRLNFDKSIDADSDVWPIAAVIIGIGQYSIPKNAWNE